jgi:hypothetical protein
VHSLFYFTYQSNLSIPALNIPYSLHSDGVNSLYDQDCVDEPLLKLAESKPDKMAFVHIVQPSGAKTQTVLSDVDSDDGDFDIEDSDELIDTSSDEEAEFE